MGALKQNLCLQMYELTAASLKWKVGAWSIQGLPLLAVSP